MVIKNVVHRKGKTYENIICWGCSRFSWQRHDSTVLTGLKRKYTPTVTIMNGENAAGGRGITEKIYRNFLECGAQAVTLGNHAWDNREIFDFIDDAKNLARPANFPEGTPGKGNYVFVNVMELEVAVINLQGRTFFLQLIVHSVKRMS